MRPLMPQRVCCLSDKPLRSLYYIMKVNTSILTEYLYIKRTMSSSKSILIQRNRSVTACSHNVNLKTNVQLGHVLLTHENNHPY
jgi:hypothetical protein